MLTEYDRDVIVIHRPTGRSLGQVRLEEREIVFGDPARPRLIPGPIRLFRIVAGMDQDVTSPEFDLLLRSEDGQEVAARVVAMPIARDCPGFILMQRLALATTLGRNGSAHSI